MAAHTTPRPTTLCASFSFYVPHTDTATLAVVDSLADAVTVKGPKGPATIRDLRLRGWDTPVIFDRSGYDPKIAPVDAERWFDEQATAGADRPLTAGTWVAWSEDRHMLDRAIEIEGARCNGHPEATTVFALDYRWLTKAPMDVTEALNAIGHPTALVLSHPTDPLSPGHAVEGLITVTRNVENVSILRTDHGGFGALAYGACHTAIGLRGTYRHFVPPESGGGGKTDDRSARVFVRDLMDWFTAATIAGWTTNRVKRRCPLACCGGSSLDRFFDPRYDDEATSHNRITLSQLADDILDAPSEERRRQFSQLCLDAIDRYGPMGKLSMVTKPKAQLEQWTFS